MATLFTKIINREIPGHFVYEDDTCVAFLTIAPRADGHLLVVPRVEVETFTDLDADVWAHVCVVAQKLGGVVQREWGTPKVGVLVEGFEVPHVHVHVWPAADPSSFDPSSIATTPVDQEHLAETAARIVERLRQEA